MRFSVIIPVYNVEAYLKKCLDTICSQSYDDWEAICVDDGSADGSGKILDEYAAKDKRFRVFHQHNFGVNFARQKGLLQARGEWIVWIDPDDWVSNDWLVHLNGVIEDNLDLIISDFVCHKNHQEKIEKQPNELSSEELIGLIMTGAAWGGVFNKAFSREFISKNCISFPTGDRVVAREDMCFTIATLSYKPRFKFVAFGDYHYQIRDASLLHSGFSKDWFKSGVLVADYLSQYLTSKRLRKNLVLFEKQHKAAAYCSDLVTDDEFNFMFPEVKDLVGVNLPIWHRVLFWLSIHGLRSLSCRLLHGARFIRFLVYRR